MYIYIPLICIYILYCTIKVRNKRGDSMDFFNKDNLKKLGSKASSIIAEKSKETFDEAMDKRAARKEAKKYTKVLTNVIDGLPIGENERVYVTCSDSEIIIEQLKVKITKNDVVNTFRVKFENVLDVIVADKKQIINENKSVIGRGAVGSLMFGPVGAMLGGMSALGAKHKKISTDKFLVISYKNKNGDIANITFDADGVINRVAKVFTSEVKKLMVKNQCGSYTGNDIEL